MLSHSCFAEDDLKNYALGLLDEDSSSEIEQHVAGCRDCGDRVGRFDQSSDSLMRSLRLRPESVSEPSWVERLAAEPDPGSLSESAVVDSATPPADPLQVGDYRLQDVIGRGGMSVVFSARHDRLGRRVAFKVLRQPGSAGRRAIERFRREMRSIGSLSHPAIVQATDAGEHDGVHYLVMEQIDGIDLSRLLYHAGPLRVSDACRIAHDIADALVHAHEAGIVHRDIKPSNVMLDRSGRVKLLDFGLARLTAAAGDVTEQTTVGQLLGTLDYMAPEQANAADVDARADLYSLGATLFRLLTGRPPHGRSAEVALLEFVRRLNSETATPLHELRTDVPESLGNVIAKSLSGDVDARIETAAEFRDALKPFLADADLASLAGEAPSANESTAREETTKDSDLLAAVAEVFPGIAPPRAVEPEVAEIRPAGGVLTRVLRFVAAMLIGGALYFGITIILRTPDGTVHIVSDVDDVKVELVGEDQKVTSLKVNQAGGETEILAGRYRVRIAGESDGLDVSPSEIVVRRGKTSVARITQSSQGAAEPAPSPPKPDATSIAAAQRVLELRAELDQAQKTYGPQHPMIQKLQTDLQLARRHAEPIPTEPVYLGRTLRHWQALMELEASEPEKLQAAAAVCKLVGSVDSQQRTNLLVKCVNVEFLASGSLTDRLIDRTVPGSFGLEAIVPALGRNADHEVVAGELSKLLAGIELRDAALVTLTALVEFAPNAAWKAPVEAAVAQGERFHPNVRMCVPLIVNEARSRQLLTNMHTSLGGKERIQWLKLVLSRSVPVTREAKASVAGQIEADLVELRKVPGLRDLPDLIPSKAETAEDDRVLVAYHKPLLDSIYMSIASPKPDEMLYSRVDLLTDRIAARRIDGTIAVETRRLLNTLLVELRKRAKADRSSSVRLMTQSTIRAIIQLSGTLPTLARVPAGTELPRELNLLATERLIRRGRPTGLEYMQKQFAELYPVEQAELGEKYAVWLHTQRRAFRTPQYRFSPIQDIDPIIALAIVADADGGLPECATKLRELIRNESGARVRVVDAIERHQPIRRMVYEWVAGGDATAWRFLTELGPTPQHVTFLQKHLTGEPKLMTAAYAASVLSTWAGSDRSRYLHDAVRASAKLPGRYFPYVQELFYREPEVGAEMANGFLTEVAGGRTEPEPDFAGGGEEGQKAYARAVVLALQLVGEYVGQSAVRDEMLKGVRKQIADGHIKGLPPSPTEGGGSPGFDAGGGGGSGSDAAMAGGGGAGASRVTRESVMRSIDLILKK